jgi:hypothetical protein
LRLAPTIAWRSISSTPGSRSSKSKATMTESRSTPSTNWLRSFEPIEKPSKRRAKASTWTTLLGISHMTKTSSPSLPRSSPCCAIMRSTSSASFTRRQNGIIRRTSRQARHYLRLAEEHICRCV